MSPGRTARLNPPLHGPRLHLAPMRAQHAGAMFDAIGDPALYAYIDHGPPASAEWLRERYRKLESRASADGSETWLNWVLFAHESPQPLGCVQASLLADGRAWVAYLLARSAWGRGYAGEAMAAMLTHLFGTLGARQAMAMVEQANLRSIALLQRLGFTPAQGDALQGHELTATEALWLLPAPLRAPFAPAARARHGDRAGDGRAGRARRGGGT